MIKSNEKKSSKPVRIPEKLFYKIGEVGRITGVETYVLRYWESEFPFLRLRKSRSGQRLYVKKDIELISEVRRLLYDERYTIEGVKKRFSESHLKVIDTEVKEQKESTEEILSRVKARLKDLIKQLS